MIHAILTLILGILILMGCFYVDKKTDVPIFLPYIGEIKYPVTICGVLGGMFVLLAR